jgi:hypothetical protein
LPGQQFAQHHAERVDVDCDGGLRAPVLFRRRILGRQCQLLAAFRAGFGVEQGRDAEVEHLQVAARIDQHVRWLQVAVHDQRRVRGIDRPAQAHEQFQALREIERAQLGGARDRLAIDQLHRYVRNAGFADSGFDQARDVGMRELGQDRLLAVKASLGVGGVETDPQQLERDDLCAAAGGAIGPEYRRGTAFADQVEHPERPDVAPDQAAQQLAVLAQVVDRLLDRNRQHPGPARFVLEHFEQGPGVCIRKRQGAQTIGALARAEIDQLVE